MAALVYGLINLKSGKVYVGCTSGRPNAKRQYLKNESKLAKRFREHKSLLNSKKHSEPKLQKDWLESGPDEFKIILLEEVGENVSASKKREAELKWMKKYEDEGLLYNTYKESFSFTKEATKAGIEASRTAGRWHNGVPKDHGRKISEGKRRARILRST